MQSPSYTAHSLGSRIPARREILEVFGVVLFVVFGWSIRGFLYKIPAFSLYFGLRTDLAILCYMFAFALFESLLATVALVALASFFPPQILKSGFAYKGFLIVLVGSIALVAFDGYYRVEFFKDLMAGDRSSIPPLVFGLVVSLGILLGLLWLFHSRPWLQKYAHYATQQISVFTFIYVPLGLIGLIVVIARNLP